MRIAGCCFDDNRHYRDNFLNISNFWTKLAPRPSLFESYGASDDYLLHHREWANVTPAIFYWLSVERASSITALRASGPSTLGISILKWAPSGNLAVLAAAAGSSVTPCRARTSAPVIRHRLSLVPAVS